MNFRDISSKSLLLNLTKRDYKKKAVIKKHNTNTRALDPQIKHKKINKDETSVSDYLALLRIRNTLL